MASGAANAVHADKPAALPYRPCSEWEFGEWVAGGQAVWGVSTLSRFRHTEPHLYAPGPAAQRAHAPLVLREEDGALQRRQGGTGCKRNQAPS